MRSALAIPFVLLACATPKSELVDSGSFSIAEATQERSIGLKKTCAPIEARQAITDKDAVAFAINNRVDTVQVFRTYPQPNGIFSFEVVRDLRFWNCEGKTAAPVVKRTIKSPRGRAKLAFLRFDNTTKFQAQNYAWLAETLPEAVDVAMQSRFVYEAPPRQTIQTDFDSMAAGGKGVNSRLAELCARAELDYAVIGEYFFDAASGTLNVQAAIYHSEKQAVIGQISRKSPVDASIFGKITDVADMVVKTLAAYEARR
mgnify:CR=1 FL=1